MQCTPGARESTFQAGWLIAKFMLLASKSSRSDDTFCTEPGKSVVAQVVDLCGMIRTFVACAHTSSGRRGRLPMP